MNLNKLSNKGLIPFLFGVFFFSFLTLGSCSSDSVDEEEPIDTVGDTGDDTDTDGDGNTDGNGDTDGDGDTNGALDPNAPPSSNFDLSTWNISIPIDMDKSGTADNISVASINNGFEHPDYFYTGDDGGMVFKCTVAGYKTSKNTSFVRSEFREMLRGTNTSISTQGVNKNNWVFGSAPESDINAAAAFDGELRATLAVNHVSTTGSRSHVGRVIIGQIHANDDEPVRLYYRKLPGHTKGSIYFAHETNENVVDREDWYNMIGRRDNDASDPDDGIELGEQFSYIIKVKDNNLWVTIIREGKDDVVQQVIMSSSGYDVGGQYMYFKAGVYIQDNTGDDDDYTQATFYNLETSHTTN